jgi:excinuclease UvrABC nuclease subunit
VYVLRGLGGEVLFVGAAGNLRVEVRDLFCRVRRRGVGAALHLATALDHEVIATDVAAGARAEALVALHRPRFQAEPQVALRR